MISFEYKTNKTFTEIVDQYNYFKKLQDENLFGSIEEFDFKEVEILDQSIYILRKGFNYMTKTGQGEIIYIFKDEGKVYVELFPLEDVLKIRKRFVFKFSIVFGLMIMYQFYKTNEINYFFTFFCVILVGLVYLFYTMLYNLNQRFLKDFSIRFLKCLDK